MQKLIYAIFICTILFSFVETSNKLTLTTPQESQPLESVKTPISVSHAPFNVLLAKYVSNEGVVNYKGFKTEQNKLIKYITTLKSVASKSTWTRNEKLVYWINLYNSLTINLLLNHYPIQSITKIDKAWDTNIVTIEGTSYTLNEIENNVIRPTFNEPRIHFAVNCGALSCPKLLNEAFVPDRLEKQLEKQTIAFINNSSHNKITINKIQISKIFDWYAADFGNIITFFNNYSTTKINPNAEINYLEYQWDLNGY